MLIMYSPIRSLIEAGFGADKRADVRLYYGARNLSRMAYQVFSLSCYSESLVYFLEKALMEHSLIRFALLFSSVLFNLVFFPKTFL